MNTPGWATRFLRPARGRARRLVALGAAAVLLAAGAAVAVQSSAQAGPAPEEGIDCDTDGATARSPWARRTG